MAFVKIVKNKSYFRRFQTQYRRRREAKTDYYARKRLIIQDKNKYKTPKYRLVVRITNRDVICQIVAADLTHDSVIAAAYSHELPRYGVKLGLTNYAAAYCTGLLIARRINKQFNLAYEGQVKADGEHFEVEAEEEGAKPFKALLDIGLARTTAGARIFGAMKGAVDGGLNVPHNDNRFPGSKRTGSEWTTDAAAHRKYIFGGHITDYMTSLKADDEESYGRQFKRYISAKIGPKDLESVYTKAHAAIRADPSKARAATELGYFKVRKADNPKFNAEKDKVKTFHASKRSLALKKNRVLQIIKARAAKAAKTA